MTNSTNYSKPLACVLLIAGLCLVNFASMGSQYPEGSIKTTTDMTLEARYIIVGEVTHVSFVFEQEHSGPNSLVTVRVDKDMKQEIERADDLKPNRPGRQASSENLKIPPQTVTFVQIGGPYRSFFGFLPFFEGDWVTAAGVRTLKRGEHVFLKLFSTTSPVKHDGQTANSFPHDHGSIYSVRGEGEEVDKHIIEGGWLTMDVTVLQMTRIVRATLKQPERMRTLARRVRELKRMPFVHDARGQFRPKQPDDRLPLVMDEVMAIETELNLSPLDGGAREKRVNHEIQ